MAEPGTSLDPAMVFDQSDRLLRWASAGSDLLTALCCLAIGATLVVGLRRRRREPFPAQAALAPLALMIGLFGFGAFVDLFREPPLHHPGQILGRVLVALCSLLSLLSLRPRIETLLSLRTPEELVEARRALRRQRAARRRAEAELLRTRSELARTVRELEQYTTVTAQDLQIPLRTVAGFSQLLLRRHRARGDAEAREFLGYIEQSARQMQTLIHDLQTLSRVGADNRFERRPLGETLQRALGALRGEIDDSGAEIVVGALPEIEADHRQLARLLQQLVGNAIKFRKPGQRPRIEIRLTRGEHDWLLEIADNGIGIPADRLEDVFTLFRRLRDGDSGEGPGIGLALCRRIAGHHGGEIWASSDVNGTRLHLRLPVAPAARQWPTLDAATTGRTVTALPTRTANGRAA